MINYALYTQLRQLILQVSDLTANLYLTAGSFYKACLQYLNKLSAFADEHRMTISSDISLAINKLLVYNGEAKEKGNRNNLRKERDAYAVICLDTVCRQVKEFLDKNGKTIEECADIWRQMLARAVHKGLNLEGFPPETKLDSIICTVCSDAELLPYYSHVIGLLGKHNAKAILDTVLPQLQL